MYRKAKKDPFYIDAHTHTARLERDMTRSFLHSHYETTELERGHLAFAVKHESELPDTDQEDEQHRGGVSPGSDPYKAFTYRRLG